MKNIYKYIIIILSIVHAFFIIKYGVSTFSTTCIFYIILYILLNYIFKIIFKNKNTIVTITNNIKFFFIIIIIIEFALSIILSLNEGSSIRKFVYFSDYKRKEQCELLQKIGFKNARFTFTEAYIPNSKRIKSTIDYSYTHFYNQIGLRGKLPPTNKDTNEYRIVILGDSFIEGDGTPEDSTMCTLLSKKLNKNNLNIHYSVINAGISGSNPIYEVQIYRKLISKYKPDLVILSIYNNDLSDIYIMKNSGNLPFSECINSISHIFRVFYYLKFSFENSDNYNLPQSIIKRRIQTSKILSDNIENFRTELIKNNTGLFLIYIPSKSDIRSINNTTKLAKLLNYNVNLYNEFIQLDSNHYKFVDKYYWKNDAHFKPKGYNLVAEILAKKIKDDVRSY